MNDSFNCTSQFLHLVVCMPLFHKEAPHKSIASWKFSDISCCFGTSLEVFPLTAGSLSHMPILSHSLTLNEGPYTHGHFLSQRNLALFPPFTTNAVCFIICLCTLVA